jgi:hypothetical protein
MCQIPRRIIVDHVIRGVIARPSATKAVNTTPGTEEEEEEDGIRRAENPQTHCS